MKIQSFLVFISTLIFTQIIFANNRQYYGFKIYKGDGVTLTKNVTWYPSGAPSNCFATFQVWSNYHEDPTDPGFIINPNNHVYCPGEEIIVENRSTYNYCSNNADDFNVWQVAISSTPPTYNGNINFDIAQVGSGATPGSTNIWESSHGQGSQTGSQYRRSLTIPQNTAPGVYYLYLNRKYKTTTGYYNCSTGDEYVIVQFTVASAPEPLEDIFRCDYARPDFNIDFTLPHGSNIVWHDDNPDNMTFNQAFGESYPYTITNSAGCSYTGSVNISTFDWNTYDPMLNSNFTYNICNTGSQAICANEVPGFSAEWRWNGNNGQQTHNGFCFIPPQSDLYYTLVITNDATGCEKHWQIYVSCGCQQTYNYGPNQLASVTISPQSNNTCKIFASAMANSSYTIYQHEWTVTTSIGGSIPVYPDPSDPNDPLKKMFYTLPGQTYYITYAFIYNDNGTCYRRYKTHSWTAPGGIIVVPWGKKSMEAENEVEIKVYPNPSKGEFNITLPSVENTIQVFDLTGALVHEEVLFGSSKVYLNDKESGVYIMKVSNENGVETIRLNINN